MLAAARVFRDGAARNEDSSQLYSWLSDNYYLLATCAESCADNCKKIQRNKKDSAELSGLYDLCRKICRNGVLPAEKELAESVSDMSGCFLSMNLPLTLSCALIEYAREAVEKGDVQLLSDAVKSLRRLGETDFEAVYAASSKVEKLMNADPSGVYPELDERTKGIYRKAVYRKSKRCGKSEEQVTAQALLKAKESSRHAGEFIFSRRKKFIYGKAVILLEIIMPLLSAACASIISGSFVMGILLLFPFSAIWRYLVGANVVKTAKPVRLMRLKTDSRMVDNVTALITVSMLLPPANEMDRLSNHLEKLYLSNGGDNIKICCLADFKGADTPSLQGDKTDIRAAMRIFDRLNERYSGGFILAVRPRVYSKTQDEFTGKERKRGAISDLVKAIKGEEKGFSLLYGDKKKLKSVKYIIALDADTELEFDGARSLIAVAEHPLNRPVTDKEKGRVTKGYGIIVPRAENKVDYSRCTFFEKIMAGGSCISVYDAILTEKYQALFSESLFCGKGLIDVDAYNELLTDGLPEERILSHDIIEGGYLRVGFASDIKITESFPKTVESYFRRHHRWCRGDLQNIPFIFGKNSLNFVSRYKLSDNIIRTVTAPSTLVSLAVSPFIGGAGSIAVAAISAFSLILPDICAGINALLNGGFCSVSCIFYSGAVPAALGAFARAFIRVSLSVKEGLTAADACIKALWRLALSKKNLLEWSTAAMSEKTSGLFFRAFSCLPSVLFFVLLFAFGSPLHRLIAIIILCEVPLTLLGGNTVYSSAEKLTSKSKEELQEYSAAMWNFFDDLCNRENNFLPPDNIQFAPVGVAAKQTSPTNIGLALLSYLAARDFGYISSEELCIMLGRSLESIEQLKKYKGNLYNWYNVKTLEILKPAFISTVDSGNFLCCLVALTEGLREYCGEYAQLSKQIERIDRIIAATDLGFLYNKHKKLFSIGYYPDENKASGSCYDMLMSEARMTSFFAIASRQVPKEHWSSLGRILVSDGRHCGLASWSGTMFEYFMPAIFMNSPAGSITDESLRFCLQCQKKRAGKRPFGVSESGYYAFDAELNYRYKAHGIQKIGVSRGLNKEFVISPYSSFLTLAIKPELSLRNLRRIKNLGAYGKYGFFEAVDFTAGRVSSSSGAIVRSFMAHHVGMSFLATDNALHGKCMQQRFMRNRMIKGAQSLLEEQIQPNIKVFKDIRHEEPPEIRERKAVKAAESLSPDITQQQAAVYSNGHLSSVMTDCGCGFLTFEGINATVRSLDALERPEGIFAVFESDGEVIPFAAALDIKQKAEYSARFEREKAIYTAQNECLKLKTEVCLLKKANCEERKYTVKNKGSETLSGRIIINLNPCLDNFKSFSAHPAFSRLFLTDKKDETNNSIIIKRNLRKGEQPCAMLCAIKEDTAVKLETSREKVFQAPQGVFSLGMKTDFGSARGNPDCCCAFSAEIEVKSGETACITLLTVLGETEKEVTDIFETVKSGKVDKQKAQKLQSNDAAENEIIKTVLPSILYPKNGYITQTEIKEEISIADIWRFGISGDIPIVLIEVDSPENLIQALPYIRISRSFRECGIAVDTVVCHSCDEGYNSDIFQQFAKLLTNENCELMLGIKGGFHVANFKNCTQSELETLKRTACVKITGGNIEKHGKTAFFKRYEVVKSEKQKIHHNVKRYNFTQGEIIIKKEPVTVDIPWFMCLANRTFGTMVSDKAIGFTWAQNSHENKLTPWYNDMCSDNCGEILFAKYKGAFYDLAAIGYACFTPEKALWRGAFCDFDFCVEVTVPSKGMCKKIAVEIQNKSSEKAELELFFYTLPVLSDSRDSVSDFTVSKIKNGAVIGNNFAPVRGYFAVLCSGEADSVCLSKPDFYSGKTDKTTDVPKDLCCAVGKRIVAEPSEKSVSYFYISWATHAQAAVMMPQVSEFIPKSDKSRPVKTAIKKLDIFCNSFLYHQIKNSRFLGRTGPYQCSGAYGFRDQLQDSLVFLETEPELCRQHLLRCAAVQFEEGDVLHWWHSIGSRKAEIKGVRTLCSDDMLWMPYVLCEYLKKTSDYGILDVKIPYIIGEKLSDCERERYIQPEKSKLKDNLLVHCVKAAEYSMKYGENGFPLIGSCDWNDAFSLAGNEESGESIWLAMFQIIVFSGLADVCNKCNMKKKARQLKSTADSLKNHVETAAWNGEYYNRAILRDGTILGGENGYIDILPQAFAVFAGLKNAEKAVMKAFELLFDKENRVIRLMNPPFEESDRDKIGYIAAYPPGIRENAGQYTHAAVWLARALLQIGRVKEGTELLNAINPLEKYSDENLAISYRCEPYVLAGDVSYAENAIGRGGWTHFTGAAAWFYRTVSEFQQEILNHQNEEKKTDL